MDMFKLIWESVNGFVDSLSITEKVASCLLYWIFLVTMYRFLYHLAADRNPVSRMTAYLGYLWWLILVGIFIMIVFSFFF